MFSIQFDTKRFTQKINGIRSAAIPEAQKKSFFKFGMLNKKKMMPYMRTIFRNPVTLTLGSVLFKVQDHNNMIFFIKGRVPKGNQPRKYLAPVEFTTGGFSTAYETKFSYWLRNYSGLGLSNRYPIPAMGSSAVQPNKTGTGMLPSQYTKVRAGLIKSQGRGKITGNQYWYFAVPTNGKKGRGGLADGIYRVKGNQLGLLFTLAKKRPQVPQKFQFLAQTANTLKKDMPAIFKSELRKQLAQFK